jgi:hypothetical protein
MDESACHDSDGVRYDEQMSVEGRDRITKASVLDLAGYEQALVRSERLDRVECDAVDLAGPAEVER